MALGKNAGPSGLPVVHPHDTDHGASGAVPAAITADGHDVAMLGQTGHSVTAGVGYEIRGTHGPVGPPVPRLSDDYDRGF